MRTYVLYGLLCLGISMGLLFILGPASDEASASPTPPPAGDWYINATEDLVFTDEVVEVNGSVIVNGSLTIQGSSARLIINSTFPGEFGVLINESASFNLTDGATMRSWSGSYRYWFHANVTSHVKFADAVILFLDAPTGAPMDAPAGLLIETDDVTFVNNTVQSSEHGLVLNHVTTTSVMSNNYFSNVNYAIILNDTTAAFSGSTIINSGTAIVADSSMCNLTGDIISDNSIGIIANTSTLTLVDVTLFANTNNVYLLSSVADMTDCMVATVVGVDYTLDEGSTVRLHDTGFEGASVDLQDGSNTFTAYWTVDVQVLWSSDDTPINNTTVDIDDEMGTGYVSQKTDITGLTPEFEVIAFVKATAGATETSDWYTPHNFSATCTSLNGWVRMSILEPQTVTVHIRDHIAPHINVTSPGLDPLMTPLTSIEINGTAWDNEREVDRVMVGLASFTTMFEDADMSVDNGTVTWNHTLFFPYDGKHLVVIKVTDISGNEKSVSFFVTVDTVAPALDIEGPRDDACTNIADQTIKGSTEKGANLTINGSAVTVDNTGLWSIDVTLVDGDNVFTVVTMDAVGNTNTMVLTLHYNLSTPYVSIIGYDPAIPNVVDTDSVTITGEADENATVEVDGVVASRTGKRFDANVDLKPGTNLVNIKVTDRYGNVNVMTMEFVFDNIPPTLTITSPFDGYTTSKENVTITGKVTGGATLDINGADVNITNNVFSYVLVLMDGTNTVTVTAVDGFGNSVTETMTIKRDSNAPKITISAPTNNYVTDKDSILVKGVVDANDLDWVMVNGELVTVDAAGNFETTIKLAAGNNKIVITVSDFVGNVATSTRQVTLETETTTDDDSKSFFDLLMDPTDPMGLMIWIMLLMVIGMMVAVAAVLGKGSPQPPPRPAPKPGGRGPPPGRRPGPHGRRPPPRGYPGRRPPHRPPDRRRPAMPSYQQPPAYSVPAASPPVYAAPVQAEPEPTPPPQETPVFTPEPEPVVEPTAEEVPSEPEEDLPEPEPDAAVAEEVETGDEGKDELEENIASILDSLGPDADARAKAADVDAVTGTPMVLPLDTDEKDGAPKDVIKCPNCDGEVKTSWPTCPFCDYRIKKEEPAPEPKKVEGKKVEGKEEKEEKEDKVGEKEEKEEKEDKVEEKEEKEDQVEEKEEEEDKVEEKEEEEEEEGSSEEGHKDGEGSPEDKEDEPQKGEEPKVKEEEKKEEAKDKDTQDLDNILSKLKLR